MAANSPIAALRRYLAVHFPGVKHRLRTLPDGRISVDGHWIYEVIKDGDI